MNSHEIWKSDSWDLLYKLLRSKERRMMMMMKMIAARLYIYFPYGEISKNTMDDRFRLINKLIFKVKYCRITHHALSTVIRT